MGTTTGKNVKSMFSVHFTGKSLKMSRRQSWKRSREEDHTEDDEETALTILKDFCEDTSWGGLGRVVGSNYLFFRVIWMLAFLGGLGAGIYQLVGLFQTYESKPINTHISLQHSSVCYCCFRSKVSLVMEIDSFLVIVCN